jgi:hypothetical protein
MDNMREMDALKEAIFQKHFGFETAKEPGQEPTEEPAEEPEQEPQEKSVLRQWGELSTPERKTGLTMRAINMVREHARTGNTEVPWGALEADAETGRLTLHRSEIKTEEQLFQPRDFIGQAGERKDHLRHLRDALFWNSGSLAKFDPVTVWWSGQQWFVLDGHHRLEAIDRFNVEQDKRKNGRAKGKPLAKIRRVPVEVFEGSLSDALRETTRENGKSYLTMTATQRSNWAWRVGCQHWGGLIDGKFVVAERARELHVSRNTLVNMKAAYHKLVQMKNDGEPFKETEVAKLSDMSWAEASKLARGEDEQDVWDEQRVDAEADKIKETLIRVFGPKRFQTVGGVTLFVKALLRASQRFPELSLGASEWTEEMSRVLIESGEIERFMEGGVEEEL